MYYIKYVNWGQQEVKVFSHPNGKARIFESFDYAERMADTLVTMKRRLGWPYHAMVMEIDPFANRVTFVKEIIR